MLNPSPQPIRADPDKLNSHFASTAERTLGSKPEDIASLFDLVRSLPMQDGPRFNLSKVSPSEILKVIQGLRSDCSTGVDQIPVKFLKPVASIIAPALTHTINTCIEISTFPQDWKTARISPIPKDYPVKEDDFRPVSILPVISKVFERIVLNQLIPFIEHEALYGSHMTGFRKGHSTTVLLGIRDELVRSMKRGEVSLLVFADYSKASDTVRFTRCMDWDFQKTFSFGLLAILYLHSRVSDLPGAVSEMSQIIQDLGSYSSASNLSLNKSKSNWMLVSTPQMIRVHSLHSRPLALHCGGANLEHVKETKLLGVQFDNHSSWKQHFSKVLASCYGSLCVLRKVRYLAPIAVRRQLVESLILSKLDYCDSVSSTRIPTKAPPAGTKCLCFLCIR